MVAFDELSRVVRAHTPSFAAELQPVRVPCMVAHESSPALGEDHVGIGSWAVVLRRFGRLVGSWPYLRPGTQVERNGKITLTAGTTYPSGYPAVSSVNSCRIAEADARSPAVACGAA
jgi:hypothetical protein